MHDKSPFRHAASRQKARTTRRLNNSAASQTVQNWTKSAYTVASPFLRADNK